MRVASRLDALPARRSEPHVVHAMRSFITAGSTVIDAGGNLGTYAVQFSHWVGARGRVLAFEPQSLLYKVLVANALAAGTGNMEVYHAALGFKEGSTQMASKLPDGKNSGREYDEVMAGGSGMFKVNFGGRSLGPGGEVVPMLTLDSLGLTDVSFIKLDVQGAESMVLYGARRTVLREKPSISMEDGAFFKKMFASDEMVRALGMPSEVARFDGHAWLLSVGYTEVMRSGSDVFFSHPEQRRKAEPPREGARASARRARGARRGDAGGHPSGPARLRAYALA